MASFAEQNAVRCKEAGNVLYKNERYEEVRFFYSLVKMLSCFVFCALFARLSMKRVFVEKRTRQNLHQRRRR